jgi:hypothetical protein
VRSERPIDDALPLESLDCRRHRADPKPGRDERDRRMEVRRTVDDTRGEPGLPAEREDLIVEGTRVFRRDEDEQLRLKIRYVDARPAREGVMARQSDNDRFAPECLIDETRIGGLRPDEPDIDLSVEQCLPLRDRPQVLQSDVDVREAPPEQSNHVGERPVGRGDQVADEEFAELATLGARPKCNSSATARKERRCRSSTPE